MRWSVATAAVLAVLTGCSGHSRAVEGSGPKLDLPPDWTGEVYKRAPELVVLHAASFRLGPHDGYDPMGTVERGNKLEDARTGMSARDAGIALFAYGDVPGPPFPKLEGPLELRRSDRASMEGFPAGRATYRRLFSAAGRDIEMIVEFGREHPASALVGRVNGVLRTLTVGSN